MNTPKLEDAMTASGFDRELLERSMPMLKLLQRMVNDVCIYYQDKPDDFIGPGTYEMKDWRRVNSFLNPSSVFNKQLERPA